MKQYIISCKTFKGGVIVANYYEMGQLRELLIRGEIGLEWERKLYNRFPFREIVLSNLLIEFPELIIEKYDPPMDFDLFWKLWNDTRGMQAAKKAWLDCEKRKEHHIAIKMISRYRNRQAQLVPVPASCQAQKYLNERRYLEVAKIETSLFDDNEFDFLMH